VMDKASTATPDVTNGLAAVFWFSNLPAGRLKGSNK
jgi:hypothetical protein